MVFEMSFTQLIWLVQNFPFRREPFQIMAKITILHYAISPFFDCLTRSPFLLRLNSFKDNFNR